MNFKSIPMISGFLCLLISSSLFAQAQITVNPTSIDFDSVAVTESLVRQLEITNSGTGEDLNITRMSFEGDNPTQFSFPNPPGQFTLSPGQSMMIDIQFRPTSFGDKFASVRIESNVGVSEVILAGLGTAPDIESAPNPLNFGPVILNQEVVETLDIRNLGNVDLNITNLTLAGPNSSLFNLVAAPTLPFTIAAGSFETIRVRFRPTSAGPKIARLDVESNDPDEPLFSSALAGAGASPTISITPQALSFGRVLVDRDSVKTLSISNIGTDDLVIDDLEILNDPDTLFSIRNKPPVPLTLTPGSPPLLLEVEFGPKAEGLVDASLIISHNDLANNPSIVPVAGRGVHAQISAMPDTLKFGEVTVTDFSELTIEISNPGDGPLFIENIDFFGGGKEHFQLFNPPPLPIKIKSNAPPVTIGVRFVPTSIGFKSAVLFLFNNDPDQEDNPYRIRLEGRGVKPDIDATPPMLTFGEIQVDSTRRMTTTIKNAGNEILIVSNIGIVGDNADQFTFEEVPLPFSIPPFSNDSVNVNVTFAPDSAGPKQAFLSFTNNTPDENPFDVLLTGIGTVPDIDASPNPLDLGRAQLGFSSIAVVNIVNRGRAPLTISDTAFAGPHGDLFSIVLMDTLPIVLPADTTVSTAITVQFTPDSLGDKTADLQIISNDPDEPMFAINLRGEGVEPDIAANPDSVAFDSVRVNTSAVITMQIMNIGGAELVFSDTAIAGPDAGLFAIDSIGTLPIAIPPDSAFVNVRLRFTPDSLGLKHAALQLTSNDPNGVFEVPLSGWGELPEISASPDPLAFGNIGIGSQALERIDIINTGGTPLTVTGSSVTGADAAHFAFAGGPFFPVQIAAGDSVPFFISFSPDSLRDYSVELHFANDDPDNTDFLVLTTGTGVLPDIDVSPGSLDFGTTAVGESEILSLSIFNLGIGPLVISDLQFSGSDADQFSFPDTVDLPITVQPNTDPAILRVAFSPDSIGDKNATLGITSNDPDEPLFNVPLNGRGVNGPMINAFTVSNAILNQDAAVSANVTADTTIRSVIIRYGATNTPGFPETQTLASQGNGDFTGTIPGASVTEVGLKVLLEATDDFQIISADTIYPAVQIPAGAISHTFADGLFNRWQMFSLPYLPDSVENRALQTVLDDLGEEGDFTWRIWRTDATGDSSRYLAISQLNGLGEFGRFESGNAFWLYLRDDDAGSVAAKTIRFPAMSTVPGDGFSYTILPGWNQIGNPYSFLMNWNQVESPQKDSLQVYQYSGSGFDGPLAKKRLGWTPLVNTNFDLNPYEGYAVLNPTNQSITINFQPQTAIPTSAVKIADETVMTADWQIQLLAEIDESFDVNVIGMHPQAASGKDFLDYPDPPRLDRDFVSINFDHSDWQYAPAEYSSDFRPSAEQGEMWYFSVSSSNRSVDFSIRNLAQLPDNFEVLLIDTKYQSEEMINNSERITLRDIAPGEINRFALLVGTKDFINGESGSVEMMDVVEYRLMPNYPNPFNPETHIRFQTRNAGNVSLKIYNILGQEIATLINGFKESGFYEIRWDGKNNFGTEAASGVYIYTLEANGFSQSRKMIKLK